MKQRRPLLRLPADRLRIAATSIALGQCLIGHHRDTGRDAFLDAGMVQLDRAAAEIERAIATPAARR